MFEHDVFKVKFDILTMFSAKPLVEGSGVIRWRCIMNNVVLSQEVLKIC